jgi:WD repeat-containing protein 42A
MGPRDEYIISGSDCGQIFLWNKCGEVIKVIKGDSRILDTIMSELDKNN